jgi:hypothetical protein
MLDNCVFGTYRAAAINVASLSITSANPATIRICIPQRRFEKVAPKDSSGELSLLDVSLLLAPWIVFQCVPMWTVGDHAQIVSSNLYAGVELRAAFRSLR